MLKFVKNHGGRAVDASCDTVTLDYISRTKGRLKVTTDAGQEAGLFLERGKVLAEGDILESECGKLVKVVCEKEAVTEARCEDWEIFAKCCYHLGNRHTPIQVGERWLRFKPDHVLEEMVELHGLTVESTSAAFTPESGAYAGGHSHGSHSHSHDHDHDHKSGHHHEHSH